VIDFLGTAHGTTLLGFVIGALFGSFINVCAFRIPLDQSVILPPSSCPKCKQRIPWYRNLPLITWLTQRGQARCCRFKIPMRYFWVELMTALMFGYFFRLSALSNTWDMAIVGCVFSFILISIIIIDLETMTIPDRFSMGGALLGLALSFSFPSLHSIETTEGLARIHALFTSALGLLIGSSVLYWIGAFAYRIFDRDALGEGDVKLLGCVGAFCGWKGAIFTIFGGAMIGCALLIPLMIYQKLRTKASGGKGDRVTWGKEVPFGPYLAIAALLFLGGANQWVEKWWAIKLEPILQIIGG